MCVAFKIHYLIFIDMISNVKNMYTAIAIHQYHSLCGCFYYTLEKTNRNTFCHSG